MAVSVRYLGKIPYIRCLKLQQDLVQVYKQKDHSKVRFNHCTIAIVNGTMEFTITTLGGVADHCRISN